MQHRYRIMFPRYYICSGEENLSDIRNVIGRLIKLPKSGNKLVYKEIAVKGQKVHTGRTIKEVIYKPEDAADMHLLLDDGSWVKIIFG